MTDNPHIDFDALYAILRQIAQTRDVITYDDLSQAYRARTRVDVHKRQWGMPLGDVSKRCTDVGLPPISTVVVSATDGMPGDGYWGIPGGPPHKDYSAWKAVRDLVYAADWPAAPPARKKGALLLVGWYGDTRLLVFSESPTAGWDDITAALEDVAENLSGVSVQAAGPTMFPISSTGDAVKYTFGTIGSLAFSESPGQGAQRSIQTDLEDALKEAGFEIERR